jgi:hypothetical protein
MPKPKRKTAWVFSSIDRIGELHFHIAATRSAARWMALCSWGMDREVSNPVKVTVPLPEVLNG